MKSDDLTSVSTSLAPGSPKTLDTANHQIILPQRNRIENSVPQVVGQPPEQRSNALSSHEEGDEAQNSSSTLQRGHLKPGESTHGTPGPSEHQKPQLQDVGSTLDHQSRQPAKQIDTPGEPESLDLSRGSPRAGTSPALKPLKVTVERDPHSQQIVLEETSPSGRDEEDAVGIAIGRRTNAITPKESAGSVVWAKLAKYPWWPAQVLEENDAWIPNDAEIPRRGAIPVRFFGTYDFAWIESQRAICPYTENREDYSSKNKQKSFVDAMIEADQFLETHELPPGFNEDSTPSPQKAQQKAPQKARPSGNKGKGKGRKGEGGKASKRATEENPAIKQRSVRERQDNIMQNLVLMPPLDSPYSHSLCLDGVRKLMELQKEGKYPPPQPPAVTQPPAFLAQAPPPPGVMAKSGALPPAHHPQQLQQQYLQQQLLMQHQGRMPWPVGLQAYNPQAPPINFFPGSVQSALMAAAHQGQLPPRQT